MTDAILSSSQSADGIPASCIETCPAVVSSSADSLPDVGRSARGLSLRELQLHLSSCHYLASLASARYRGSRSLADAQEAGRWLVLKEDAQKAVLALRREQFDADHASMAGDWTEQVGERGIA